jgi:L-xylulokinase
MTYLLGIDSGLTVTKAVLYDLRGAPVAAGRCATVTASPRPGWQERDMNVLWRDTAGAVRECLADAGAAAGVSAADIAAVGLSGHSDGVYAVDAGGQPVRPAILATDSRAREYVAGYHADGRADRALSLTGQSPFAASPAALYAWLRDHEPAALERTRWLLACKDWLRLCLTGEVATDPTDASMSFTDVRTQEYSAAALGLYGLAGIGARLPPVAGSAAVAGQVTPAAAASTGLRPGLPVVTGAHDADATAIGLGAVAAEAFSVVMGTFSINQAVAPYVRLDHRWHTRNFVTPGAWLHMSTSPSSASNLAWAVDLLGPYGRDGRPDYAAAAAAGMSADPARSPLFRPFLYGSPDGTVGAAFAGLRGEHRREHLLRAVLDGIVFNHRVHLDALRERFTPGGAARLAGGGSRSPAWAQLLADVSGLAVEVTDADEVGARGAAMLAAIGLGQHRDLEESAAAMVRVARRHDPSPSALLEERYRAYRALAADPHLT